VHDGGRTAADWARAVEYGAGNAGREIGCDRKACNRSQIIGKARKNGNPTRKCHQLPWFPGTLKVTASQGEVSEANGRKIAATANSQTSSANARHHSASGCSLIDAVRSD